MPKIKNPPLWVSQNFLTSSLTIKRIINISGIDKTDHVVEIGAGKGHITTGLIEKSGRVTALEIDKRLYGKLTAKFCETPGLSLICEDFFGWKLPATPYKVFANIPFSGTTEIIKKLTSSGNPPDEAWLVVEKGAAKRFMGHPRESSLSLSLKPFYDCGVKYYFQRQDFHPAPSVDAVLFYMKRKAAPDILLRERGHFNRFITACLSKPNMLYTLLTKKQISTAFKKAGLPNSVPPSGDMLYVQWLCLFRCYMKYGKR